MIFSFRSFFLISTSIKKNTLKRHDDDIPFNELFTLLNKLWILTKSSTFGPHEFFKAHGTNDDNFTNEFCFVFVFVRQCPSLFQIKFWPQKGIKIITKLIQTKENGQKLSLTIRICLKFTILNTSITNQWHFIHQNEAVQSLMCIQCVFQSAIMISNCGFVGLCTVCKAGIHSNESISILKTHTKLISFSCYNGRGWNTVWIRLNNSTDFHRLRNIFKAKIVLFFEFGFWSVYVYWVLGVNGTEQVLISFHISKYHVSITLIASNAFAV